MKKSIILAKNNLKKSSKQILSFSCLLLIASILFSTALVLNNNIDKNYDKKYEELNTANVFYTIPSIQCSNLILSDIKNMKNVNDIEVNTGIMLTVQVEMNGEKQDQNQIFYNIDNKNKINKYEIVKSNKENIKDAIYIPYYIYINSNLEINKKYDFETNNKEYSFNIKGIFTEMQYGNYTSSVMGIYLESDAYNHLLENNLDKEVKTISVITKDSDKVYDDISKYLSKNNINIINKNYDKQSKKQRLAISNIIILILITFSLTILLISLLVSKFRIENNIEEEITNMGVLKSLGYTSNEIIFSIVLPYIITGLITSLIGIILSYFLIPVLLNVIAIQSGFISNVGFDLLSNIIVLFINIILITLFSLLAAKKIKKLNPINAIRGINENKNNKNHFAVEKTFGNINIILMLKNFINTKKQNILLAIVLFLITILGSFVGLLFYNINLNPINFINTLVEEYPSVVVNSDIDIKDEILKNNKVKKALYYDENVSINLEEISYKTFVAETFENLANDLCYEGRNPENSSEIAIGSSINENYDLNIGDSIALSKNGITSNYTIVGLIQSVNYAGEVIEMTLEGYKKLDNNYIPNTLYIYLENENDATKFIENLKNSYGYNLISVINYVESMNAAMNMYISLISVICIVIIIITLLLIYLILYVLISSIITKRKQELGIYKAIGYSNKQLILQLVGGFIPSTLISTIFGAIISKLYMNYIYEFIFKSVGAYKISFEYPIIIFILVVILIIFSTMFIGILLAKKIKKISVYSLIKE